MTQLPLRQTTHRPTLVRRDWLLVAIMTVVMITVWISITVYAVMFKKKATDPLRRRLQQFSPDIDEKVLEELGQFRQINPDSYLETQRIVFRLDQEQRGDEATASGLLVPTPTE